LREAVFVLGQSTSWGLNELLSLEEDDLINWLEVAKRIDQNREHN
jgi:hypothetical protein